MSIRRRLHVHTSGSGEVHLVFAHGYGCDQNMWRQLWPMFTDGYRVTTYDLAGCGGSDLEAYDFERYGSLDGHARDVIDLVDELGGKPVVFIGHSVSGTIGMLAAIAAPSKFSRQIMIGPSPCYVNDGNYVGGFSQKELESLLGTLDGDHLGWASAMAPVIMGAPAKPELTAELEASFCRMDPAIAGHFARVTFLSDHRADVPKMPVPSLVLQCTDDVIAPVAVGEYLARQMPHSRLKMIANIGHCPHLSAPRSIAGAIRDFLGGR